MIDQTWWVLTDGDTIYKDWEGDALLFRSKNAAQMARENNLRGDEYRMYKPKKVTVRDGK